MVAKHMFIVTMGDKERIVMATQKGYLIVFNIENYEVEEEIYIIRNRYG